MVLVATLFTALSIVALLAWRRGSLLKAAPYLTACFIAVTVLGAAMTQRYSVDGVFRVDRLTGETKHVADVRREQDAATKKRGKYSGLVPEADTLTDAERAAILAKHPRGKFSGTIPVSDERRREIQAQR